MNNKQINALQMIASAVTVLLNEEPMRPRVELRRHDIGCTCSACRPAPAPFVAPAPAREPDGVRINVDRPRREQFSSHARWAAAMADYRVLIDQAKKCERWPSRKPADIPAHVHNNRRDWYRDNEPVGRRCNNGDFESAFLCAFGPEW